MRDTKAYIIQIANLQIETSIEYPELYWEELHSREPYEPYEIHT